MEEEKMKRKIISLLLTVALIVSVCCVFASAAPYYRYDYVRYYDYYKFTADVDVDAEDLVCKSEVGNTTTAYVPKTTEKAYIDVDTTGRCSVSVSDSDHAVYYSNGKYEIILDEGWNTVTVTVTADRYYFNPALYWAMYHVPVTKPEPPAKTEPEGAGNSPAEQPGQPGQVPPAKPEDGKNPPPAQPGPDHKPEPQKPVYIRWYPKYRTSDVTKTFTVKIYRGDAETCGHVPCLYEGCGKHACTIHGSYDLGTVSADTHKITAITNQGGGVSSADAKFTDNKVVSYLTVEVVNGAGAEINIVPQTGYTINKITVDGVSVPLTLKYTFSEVTADHSIAVEFAPVN